MCPFCLATMGLVLAGAGSTGALAALAVTVSRKRKGTGGTVANSEKRRNQDGNEHDSKSENSDAR